MQAIWKDIKGYDGMYQVSDTGLVKSRKRKSEILLKPIKSYDGYLRVPLCKDGIEKRFSVHRLVAEAFIPNPNNLPQVNHINEIKTDNRVCNLEWVTQKDNINYGIGALKRKEKSKIFCSKLGKRTYAQACECHRMKIIQKDLNGNIIKIFNSQIDAANELGLQRSCISSCVNGKRKSTGGFIFEKANE